MLSALLGILIRQKSPISVSCRLRPTRLAAGESAFVEAQIALCERYMQASLTGTPLPLDLSGLEPTLQAVARMHQTFQIRRLQGLSDNAGLLTVEVASPERIPPIVSDVLGQLFTQPAGGHYPGSAALPEEFMAGGYETIDLADQPAAAEAFGAADLFLPGLPGVPAAAGRLVFLFDSVEATAGFRLPPATLQEPAGLEMRNWRHYPPPRALPEEGVSIGHPTLPGDDRIVRIPQEDRHRHVYILGQTGTGKSSLLRSMILDDIEAGHGVCLIDPHGDLFREVVASIPPHRVDDVVLFDPTDTEFPVGLNILEFDDEAQRYLVVNEFLAILRRLMNDEYGASNAGSFGGPVFYQHMRMNALLVMSRPSDPGTLHELYALFQEPGFYKRWLPLQTGDRVLESWVENVLPSQRYNRSDSDGNVNSAYWASKLEPYVFDPMLRHIFSQQRSTIDLQDVMNSGKILLVNLAKGELTERNSAFLGMVMLARLQTAAMARARIPRERRRPFHLYVDEFQTFATENFVTLLSEGRKFGLSLVLANQFLSQIENQRIVEAIAGNVGTILAFRIGAMDAERMALEFAPTVTKHDLINLANFHVYARMLISGQATRPFSLRTAFRPAEVDTPAAAEVRDRSRRRYGRPRAEVELELAERFAVREEKNEARLSF
ncbi:MAG: type IV secretion system DNA-binding domain-containing protein [Candidatus Sericytochromatia bacterium]|nr:type IV secretion system DNA-binding domain-containing protein [Candidatus Tanganyikabacteria bacterium]